MLNSQNLRMTDTMEREKCNRIMGTIGIMVILFLDG